MGRTLSIDIETRSSVDLGACGVHKYVESEDFTILLFAYAYDDDPVRVVDFTAGEELPPPVKADLWDKAVLKTAFNAAFERTCIGYYYSRYCDPDQWQCSMVLASVCGLPASLEGAGQALGLGEEQAKMAEGKQLVRFFCLPKKGGGFNQPKDAPDRWETFTAYNKRDVEAERTIRQRLLSHSPDKTEQRFWCLDQRINDTGVRIDRALATHAVQFDTDYKTALTEEAVALTGIDNPKSNTQVKAWLLEQEGIEVPSLNKKVIADVVAQLSSEKAKAFMDMRSHLSKSSTKKYEAMLRSANADDHIRGMFQFYGAARSGRFAGRRVQLQNLSKNYIPDIDSARQLVRAGDYEGMQLIYPDITKTLSELVRTALIPEEGHHFIVADFSAIEARVLAWLAGEQWRLDVFENGGDIYCASASQMFHVPVVKHGENGHLRQKGKVAELACIAEHQLVLTDIGLVPIEKVTTGMKLWDGAEWVSHEGLVYKGVKQVIEYEGLTATPDHLVFVEGEDRPIYFGDAARSGAHLKRAGYSGAELWPRQNNQRREALEPELEPLLCLNRVSRLRARILAGLRKLAHSAKPRLPELLTAESGISKVVRPTCDGTETALPKPTRRRLSKLRRSWDKLRLSVNKRGVSVDNGELRHPGRPYESRHRPDRQREGLCAGKPPLGYTGGELRESAQHRASYLEILRMALRPFHCRPKTELGDDERGDTQSSQTSRGGQTEKLAGYKGVVREARTYDLLNAGPRHRFTVSGVVVHNCGYGGGIGALKAFGADKMGMTAEEMVETIDHWRESSPRIVAFWRSLERAAVHCVVHGAPTHLSIGQRNGSIDFNLSDQTLWITLPSGRALAYYKPMYIEVPKKRGKSLTYMGVNQTTRKWERTETFGGKITENITQAIARDCLRDSMLALADEGYSIRAHVHDEVIIDEHLDSGRTVEDVCAIMGRELPWAKGLPLRADGYSCPYYIKD